MAPINLTEMSSSEARHQSRMAMLSREIKIIAFKKQEITKEFQKGDEVEVAMQEYGFIGSYYNATIVCSTGPSHYRIKYKTLLADDESEPLDDVVTAAEIRPVPPHQHETIMSDNGFCLYDMVDVFANNGWWFGFLFQNDCLEDNKKEGSLSDRHETILGPMAGLRTIIYCTTARGAMEGCQSRSGHMWWFGFLFQNDCLEDNKKEGSHLLHHSSRSHGRLSITLWSHGHASSTRLDFLSP